MENVILTPVQQEYTDFMNLPMGVYKNIQYYNQISGRSFFESNLCKKEGCTYYSHVVFRIKKSKNGYYRQNVTKNGFTLNEKGKLSIWYNKNIFEIPGISGVFAHLKMNWLNEKVMAYVTKTIAEKMIAGKITNNVDIVKAYIKVMRLQCSPRLFFQVIKTNMYNKPHLLQMMSVAKDQDHFLQKCLDDVNHKDEDGYRAEFHGINDLVKQAQILGRSVDYTWSINRMKEEHAQWTKEIMEIEIKDMQDVTATCTLPYLKFTYPGFKLLTTKKEIFAEGKEMRHCVYTNYWSSVNNGHYLVYQVDFFGERATLGLNLYEGKLTYNQCYRESNKVVSDGLRNNITIFIKELNNWSKQNNIFKQENLKFNHGN